MSFSWVLGRIPARAASTVLTVSSFLAGGNNSKYIFLSAILHVLFRVTNSLFKNIRKYKQFKDNTRLKSPKY